MNIEWKIGDKVVKNPNKWIENDFDSWGRGEGIGEVVGMYGEDLYPVKILDIKWPMGRCYETIDQVLRCYEENNISGS